MHIYSALQSRVREQLDEFIIRLHNCSVQLFPIKEDFFFVPCIHGMITDLALDSGRQQVVLICECWCKVATAEVHRKWITRTFSFAWVKTKYTWHPVKRIFLYLTVWSELDFSTHWVVCQSTNLRHLFKWHLSWVSSLAEHAHRITPLVPTIESLKAETANRGEEARMAEQPLNLHPLPSDDHWAFEDKKQRDVFLKYFLSSHSCALQAKTPSVTAPISPTLS